VRYDGVLLDYLDGDLTYSPVELALLRGHARAVKWKQILRPIFPDKVEFSAGQRLDSEVKSRKKSRPKVWNNCSGCLIREGSLTGNFTGGARESSRHYRSFRSGRWQLCMDFLQSAPRELNVSPDEVRIATRSCDSSRQEKKMDAARELSRVPLVTGTMARRFRPISLGRRCRWKILKKCSRRACLWGTGEFPVKPMAL